VLDCLTELKQRFQGFVDGENTFEALKQAVNQETSNCDDTVIRDFVSNAHREGLLSDTHFKILIDEISSITGKKYALNLQRTSSSGFSPRQPKELTILNNRFVLGPIIGSGGMGVVYKARDLRKMEVNDSEDVVAIKVISSNLRAHPESLAVLQREAKKAQKLAHPNIVTVYDFDRDGDIAYMTMEFLDGIPLSKIIQTHAPLPRSQALRIINGIARGVAYAHKHNIIHFDLKPGNIFVLKDGSIKILDFGIACAFKTEEKSDHALLFGKNEFMAFTPAYASCEMIANKPPTPKDDIYALGCIAHELLTRKHPYDRMAADKAKENKLTLRHDKRLNAREYRAIKRAVELNEEKRTASVKDFLHELSKKETYLPTINVRFAALALVVLIVSGSLYLINKIALFETTTSQQATIVKKLDIENALMQAERYLKEGRLITSDKDNALTLYRYVLELDPDNVQAKSAIERIKQSYLQTARSAIKSNDLTHTDSLLTIIEASFGDDAQLQQIRKDLDHQSTKKTVERLISKANREISESHYIRPDNANAYDTFLEVQKLAPDDPRAVKGLESIHLNLLKEAEAQIRKHHLEQAESRIKDVLLITPENRDALALLNKIKTIRLSGRYQEVDINDKAQVDAPNPPLSNERLSVLQKKLVALHSKQAEYYLSKEKLLGLGEDNAAFHFSKLLEIDATNQYARRGLNRAWESLMSRVNEEIDRNEFNHAIERLENLKGHFSLFYDVDEMIGRLSTKRDQYFSKIDQREMIASLLNQAEIQVKKKRWTLPKGDNATESYLKVLKLDPENEAAQTGLKQVEDLFVARIKASIDSKKFSAAKRELHRALAVFPASQSLGRFQTLIVEARKAHEQNSAELALKQKIADLSSKAQTAMERKHYVLPVDKSAYDFYAKINSFAPESATVIKGFSRVKFLAYEQIKADIQDKNYQLAQLRINRLTQLGVDDKQYKALGKRLAELNPGDQSLNSEKTISDDYLLNLLMFANRQEAKGSVWPPETDNAYNIYKAVLALEPLNKTANLSLNKLFVRRLNFARSLLANQHWDDAERELNALEKLSWDEEKSSAIASTLKALTNQKQAQAKSRVINATF
jgi:hypothetical protein